MRAPDRRRILLALRPWSSAPDDARLRRPTDVLLLAGSLLLALATALSLRGRGQTVPPVTTVPAPADLLTWACDTAYGVVAVWALLLVVLPLFFRGRRRLLLDYLLGAVIALALGLVVARPAEGGWTETLRTLLTTTPRPVDVVGPLAVATTVVVIASPHLIRPLRWVGRLLVLVGATSAVVLGITFPVGAPGAVAIGVASAAAVHLLLGTPSGRPTPEQVEASLPDVGVTVEGLLPDGRQRPGATTLRGRTTNGVDVVVTVYGRDAWDDQVVGSLWTALTMRGESVELFGGRRHRVEHEAVVSLLAERAGVPVLPVVAAGVADDGNALLVTHAPAQRLGDVADLGDADLAGMWDALNRLHALGTSHRGIDRSTVVRRADGTWALAELDDARLAADPGALMVDRVRLLVATAVTVGHERAVAAAETALGADGMADLLPYLQSAVLDRAARRTVTDLAWSLDDLRSAAAEAAGVEPPPLLQVRRVTVRSVGIVLLVGIMAYAIVGLVAGVDLASVRQELSNADSVWLWTALAMSPVVQMGFAFSTLGASTARLRYGPVLLLEYAIQFIALTLPSTAARLALTVRFFQRFGIPPGSAISMGVIDSVSGFVVQVVLLLVILLSELPGLTSPIRGGSSSEESGGSSSPSLLAVVAVLVVAGIVVTLLVPRLRRRALGRIPAMRATLTEQVRSARSSLVVLRHPAKVATMLLGNLSAQVVQAAILGVCLYAFGETAHLSQLILINTGVSLFAGLMPVPGGMGVAEAGYTAGLQAIGVPSSVAMSTAIAFRLVTFYLPPLWGSVAMRWLHRHQYV